MLDHFSHSELACPTTDQVRLAAGFGEALGRAYSGKWRVVDTLGPRYKAAL